MCYIVGMNDKPLFDNPEKTAADLFKQHNVKPTKGLTLGHLLGFGFVLWVMWVLFLLAAVGGIVYVAWHFISKAW